MVPNALVCFLTTQVDGRTAAQLAAQLVAMSRDPASSLREKPTLMQLSKVSYDPGSCFLIGEGDSMVQ